MIEINNQETLELFNTVLLKRLRVECDKKDRSGIYGMTQKLLAYNSNRIEGSRLTERQTASLFETGTVSADGNTIFRAKDVEETSGHFRMFNTMLKTVEQPLTQGLIKRYHYDLKVGVFEDLANGYPIGEYKNRRNYVSNITTALPQEVPEKMQELLDAYLSKGRHTLDDLARFHVEYETIHPFQDGNGRTGRIVLFKECLKNGITPFIIQDSNKDQYYAGLQKIHETGDYTDLLSYLKKEQDAYRKMAIEAVIPYNVETVSELKELAHGKEKNTPAGKMFGEDVDIPSYAPNWKMPSETEIEDGGTVPDPAAYEDWDIEP